MNSAFARMRGLCRALTIIALIGAALTFQPAYANDGDDDYVPNEVAIKLFRAADLPAIAANYGLDPAPLDQFGSRPIFRLRITDGSAPPEKVSALSGDARVQYAEPNYIAQTPEGRQRSAWVTVDGIGYGSQWAAEHIGLPQAHAITRGAGIVVAVLDTGVDANHPALAGRVRPGYDFVDMDADPGEAGVAGQDIVFGHGTHVAGVIARTAPEASILPVRVLDRNGMGNMWVLAEALAYAANPDGNPATDDGADVINLSLSTFRQTDLLEDIIGQVTHDEDDDDTGGCSATAHRGVAVVAAAGNSASTIYEYPAGENVPGLLSVAASTREDRLAAFSNYGGWVHVAAPGVDIISSVPGGGYAAWSGTSMAAPFVAGQAALIRAAFPHFNAYDVANQIRSTLRPIISPAPPRIDVAKSVMLPASLTAQFKLCLPFIAAAPPSGGH